MFKKLDAVEARLAVLEQELAKEGLSSKEIARLSKERSEIEEIVNVYRVYKKLVKEKEQAKELLFNSDDPDLRQMAKEEIDILEEQILQTENKLKILMLPKDPNDEKNIVTGRWTNEEKLYLRHHYGIYDIDHLAERLNRSHDSVSMQINKMLRNRRAYIKSYA